MPAPSRVWPAIQPRPPRDLRAPWPPLRAGVPTADAEAEESKKKMSGFLKYFQKMLTNISIKLLV
jgi:hypothetical protein